MQAADFLRDSRTLPSLCQHTGKWLFQPHATDAAEHPENRQTVPASDLEVSSRTEV